MLQFQEVAEFAVVLGHLMEDADILVVAHSGEEHIEPRKIHVGWPIVMCQAEDEKFQRAALEFEVCDSKGQVNVVHMEGDLLGDGIAERW